MPLPASSPTTASPACGARRMSGRALALCVLVGTPLAPAGATDMAPLANRFVEEELRDWAADPEVVAAVNAANAARASLGAQGIAAMDAAWRAEITASRRPTIEPVLANPASDRLRARIEASKGLVVEAFVTDRNGLNVATAGLTSDAWQGDEPKFTETYPRGAQAIHHGEVEFDESTQLYVMQVAFTVVDPATGAPIGMMTVGFNAEALE